MTIKEIQTAVLLQGLSLLYHYLGGSQKKLQVRNKFTFPQWYKDIVQAITGFDHFQEVKFEDKALINSIFAEISIPPGSNYYEVPVKEQPLTFDSLPVERPDPSWKEVAIREIEDNIDQLRHNPEAILILLEKYASFIRAGKADEYSGVSLFELTRYLSALAVPENEELNDNKPYLLVSGDLSGIQNFIYTIASSGALKSLRGRSFFLDLLTRHVIYELLGQEITSSAVFLQSGGGFTLLLPNTRTILQKLEQTRSMINSWLLKELQGRIYLGLVWLPIKPEDTLSPYFSKIWQDSGRFLEEAKNKKHQDDLSTLFQIVEPIQKGKEEECQICHRDDIPSDSIYLLKGGKLRACSFCRTMYDVGDELTDFNYVMREVNAVSNEDNSFIMPGLEGQCFYSLVKQKDKKVSYLVKNSLELRDYLDGRTKPLFYADYVTSDKDLDSRKPSGITANLEDLASKSCGKKLLGSLRMDLDHLTISFAHGFNDKRGDILRYTALSRQLNYFFTIHLNSLCQAQNIKATDVMGQLGNGKRRAVSIIYAGGDDLFITGAWSSVVELAADIATYFKKYVHDNPDLTISGGVILSKPDFPLYQIARLSGEAEEKAKVRTTPCKGAKCSQYFTSCPLVEGKDGRCGRHNAGVFFYSPARDLYLQDINKEDIFSWEEITGQIIPMVQNFCALRNKNCISHLELEHLPRGFIRRLFGIVETWEQKGLLYLPLLYYMIRRMRDALASRLKEKSLGLETRRQIEELLGKENKNKGVLLKQDTVKYLWPCLTWVDLLSREEYLN